ncbi:MAG: prolyl oligopeptidase family serine peptidase [Sedimentisphaerales bacterium]|nr:prolyl oligopeptidase family serine peptidase [Sedimentisphaerales bacterium]
MVYRWRNRRFVSERVFSRKHSFTAGLILGLMLLTARAALAAEVRSAEPLKVIERCGRGALLDAGGTQVLLLAGSPYEMGYQQGYLLKDQVRTVVKTTLLITRAADSQRYDDFFNGSIEKAFARTRPFIDKRYLEEMQGLADGADLPLEDVQLANIFPELFHCSGFALMGKSVKGERLYHGRILDYMTEVGLQNQAVVTVYKPEGQNAFITVGYAGFLGSVTGMNEKQVAIGEMGGRGEGQWDGMPMTFLVRKALEESSTLQEAMELFRSMPRTCEYYYVISDGKIPDARGLACTPERFEVIVPGEAHPQLRHAITDALLMSAGERYKHLVRLVQDQYGKIGVEEALDLMNRPVAMKSCLHRVLFTPETLELWVANAADTSEANYAACYQPYYHYSFADLLARVPEKMPSDAKMIPEPSRKVLSDADSETSADTAETKERSVITGTVPADCCRIMPPSNDPKQQTWLGLYDVPMAAFDYQMTRKYLLAGYEVFEVRFPSPWQTVFPENNTVYCEYYRSRSENVRPAVIILDILDGSMTISRLIANALAGQGVDACIPVLPHYGPRRSADMQFIVDAPNHLVKAVQQAVVDVRRTARWLASQELVDSTRIGLCGTSLGGFIAALTAGVDGTFPRVGLILAGGDLVSVLTTDSSEVRRLKAEIEKRNITKEQLETFLESIEPLHFANRLKNCKVLMINGSTDAIVPPESARQLADATQAEIVWYPTDHYGMVRYLIPALGKLCGHFPMTKW